MAKYKLSHTGVWDNERSLGIPNDPGNRHWQEYQEWLAEGNVPDPEFEEGYLENIIAENEAREKIKIEIEKIAKDKIKTKKQKRITFQELFDNFEQREQEPHSDDEVVELRKDVQMLKQMVAALLDNVVKENN